MTKTYKVKTEDTDNTIYEISDTVTTKREVSVSQLESERLSLQGQLDALVERMAEIDSDIAEINKL